MASGDTLVILHPYQNEPPAASYATLDTRNGHPVLDFDGSADEDAIFTFLMPRNYAGGGITVLPHVAFTSATSGTARIESSLERITGGQDSDADGFAASQSAGVTPNGTSGVETIGSIAHTNGAQMDSCVAGDLCRLRIHRDADGTTGTDDVTTDMELLSVEIKET